ncbi:MAG TPA: pseudouridine synthase [Aromatoleum sp.]|uniref:pseudouridine synthase n=1 Tax=Aromatoleum sp. TaxID=2307007 RepID=UPI002B47586A|nr:pseudouridine synthase [Aromatoleum sp.]HJV25757.1 pseudouridine synthase [Aromatoleum sp.]
MQIERILQSQGFGSRKQCRALIRAGLVSIEGRTVDNPFEDVAPAGLHFAVDGEAWTYREKAYLMLHKPAGYECSRQPQFHHPVFALLPEPLANRDVQCVGRLDQDTTGLLLLSDDGQFIHVWSSGKKRIPKVYEVATKHPVDDALVAQLLAGVELHDEPAPIVAAACLQTGERSLRLTVTEGKYHQVKRMVAAAGNRVEGLHRSRIGGLSLPDDLAVGEWRWLDEAALALLAEPEAH